MSSFDEIFSLFSSQNLNTLKKSPPSSDQPAGEYGGCRPTAVVPSSSPANHYTKIETSNTNPTLFGPEKPNSALAFPRSSSNGRIGPLNKTKIQISNKTNFQRNPTNPRSLLTDKSQQKQQQEINQTPNPNFKIKICTVVI